MQKLLLFVDKVSTWFGKLFAWLIVLRRERRVARRAEEQAARAQL